MNALGAWMRRVGRGMTLLSVTLLFGGCSMLPQGEGEKVAQKPSVVPAVPPHKPAPPRPRPLTGQPLIVSLLPSSLEDRTGWAEDLLAVFEATKIPLERENVCAVLAEIGQESSFQTDPAVAGLSRIVRSGLEERAAEYRLPKWVLNRGLAMKSSDGRSYDQRISALKTEGDLNRLYEDMVARISFGKDFFDDYNPVQTIGPMQVNVAFANTYATLRPYPFPHKGPIREALFTRKGGLYFGVAYLLDYPANYDSMAYRFADYNAGRYSSRNAAFQHALSVVSGLPLKLDGDLLLYNKKGVPLEEPSQTMKALLAIAPRLKMDKAEIQRNLLLEKSAAFELGALYIRLFELAPTLPRVHLPEIVVGGPKTKGRLTTAAYVEKVGRRYRSCLKK